MDGKYPWKRTDEIEIDFADLLRRICIKWRWIALCALAAAVLFGAYGMWKSTDKAHMDGPDAEVNFTGLSEEQQQGIAAAMQLENEIRGLEEYLEHSVLMQIDPYHKNSVILLYSIDQAKRQELPRITESYLNFILNGGAADALKKSGSSAWKMDKNYAVELISAYQKTYSYPYQVMVDDVAENGLTAEALFYIEITGKSVEVAKQMAAEMQKVLEAYWDEVEETAGRHRLTLVSSEANITADSGLQAQQHDKKTLLASNKASLKSMKEAFNAEQKAVYQDAIGIADGEADEEAVDGSYGRFPVKYMILGFLGGMFVYCGIFSCWYVFSDRVKSGEELKRRYTVPFYGGVHLENGSGKKQGAYQDGYEQVLNRIRLACKKQGIGRICAAADFSLNIQEKEWIGRMIGQIKEWGIEMTLVENAAGNITVWDELAEIGNVLAVCRIGTTTHRMMDDAMSFYSDNGISVTGIVAFLANQ